MVIARSPFGTARTEESRFIRERRRNTYRCDSSLNRLVEGPDFGPCATQRKERSESSTTTESWIVNSTTIFFGCLCADRQKCIFVGFAPNSVYFSSNNPDHYRNPPGFHAYFSATSTYNIQPVQFNEIHPATNSSQVRNLR